MKYYVKFFENYEELSRDMAESNIGFNPCENVESIVIIEKEFEYATMKIRFFEESGPDNSKINFAKRYIKLAYSIDGDCEKLNVIFSGILENISYVGEKYYDVIYIAKPENVSFRRERIVKILNKSQGEKSIKSNKIYEGNLFLYCDKVTHEIEESNLNFNKNPIYINDKNVKIFKRKNRDNFNKNKSNCVDVRILFQLARVKMWRENLFQKVLEKFDGETLSAEAVLENVRKQLMFLKRPNVLIQKLILKVLPPDFITKEVAGSSVILKRSVIKGAIFAFWWQYLIKKVDVFAKISCFSHEICDDDAPMQNFTVRIPFEEVLDVKEWKAGNAYNIKDCIFVQNRLMFCKKSHKSRQFFDDIERSFWEKTEFNDGYISSKNNIALNITSKITRVMENIKKYMFLRCRDEAAVLNLNFEEARFLNVNNIVLLNGEKMGKIVKITHEINNKSSGSCIEIALFAERFNHVTLDISDSGVEKILAEMTRVWNTNIHSSKHLVRDVKVRNTYSEQEQIIAKKYKKIEDFERDFDKKRTKIKILFNNIPPIIRVNYDVNLGKL